MFFLAYVGAEMIWKALAEHQTVETLCTCSVSSIL